ncbi:hypothetical protein BDP81DRAFT_50331 [Colletotrichum phormii]|uniref:Uncharacterized protein n=1 Tax=Colletotrichum phormii TaxID=359342 RepID=A0AAI9ZPD4_9PEZI|nr:uncharacterized protein BDP81DRAFT_50331 [Colletotrichum phormii]KAK1634608.1 hypothetical protein BDP81DRAFT_50331 [Colletotrichum phormii]
MGELTIIGDTGISSVISLTKPPVCSRCLGEDGDDTSDGAESGRGAQRIDIGHRTGGIPYRVPESGSRGLSTSSGQVLLDQADERATWGLGNWATIRADGTESELGMALRLAWWQTVEVALRSPACLVDESEWHRSTGIGEMERSKKAMVGDVCKLVEERESNVLSHGSAVTWVRRRPIRKPRRLLRLGRCIGADDMGIGSRAELRPNFQARY